MEMQKKGKMMNAPVIAVFTVIRVVMFSYFPNFSDKTPSILFGTLLAVYAVLTAVVFSVASKKSNSKADGILLLMFADFFFTMQVHSFALAVAIVWEAYVLFAFSEKNSNVKAVLLVVAALISSLLMPYTLFSYVLLAAFVYFLVNFRKSASKSILVPMISVVAGAGGFAVNELVLKTNTGFDSFVNGYTFGRYGMPASINVAVVIPTLAVSAVLFALFVKSSKETEKNSRPADAKIIRKETVSYIVGAALMLVVAAAGFIFNQSDMYMLINLIVPSSLVALLLSKNNAAEKTFAKVNGFVSSHSFAVWFIFIVIFAIQVYGLEKTGLGGEIRSFIERLVY